MNTQQDLNSASARRMLREISQMAEEASLTGALKSGAGRLAEHYNRILQYLQCEGNTPTGMFEAMDIEQADFSKIAVDSRMLEASLGGDRKRRDDDADDFEVVCGLAPFVGSQELALLVREKMESGAKVNDRLLTALAPFLDQATLGDLIRQRLDSKPKTTPAPTPESSFLPEVAADIKPVDRLQELARYLAKPNLSEYEKIEILSEISSLAGRGDGD